MAESEEEENYWPGYVDALSTMTMVLTFVMMILVVVVFQLMQNTSKVILEKIIEESKIGGGAGTQTIESLSKVIVEAITTARESGAPVVASTEEVQTQETNIQSISVETEEVTKSEMAAEVRDRGQQAAVTVSQSALEVAFQEKATQLSDNAAAKVALFATTSEVATSGKTLEIIGYADVSGTLVSEARRLAYYRAMMVRGQLLSAGIPPERISIGVRDSSDAVKGQLVEVFGR